MQTKIKNTKRLRIISIAFLIVLFIMMPYFVFMYVSHDDSVLKNYFVFIKNTPKSTLDTFTSDNLPSSFLIFGLPYIAVGALCCAIGSSVFYINYYRKTLTFNNRMLLIGTVTITFFLFISCILFAYAEYEYDLFTEWCRSLKGGYSGQDYVQNIENMIDATIPNRDEVINGLINLATGSGTKNPNPYSWIGINVIWWITGLQMIFIIFIILKVGFKLEWLSNTTINLDKNEEIVVIKDTFNQSVAKKIIGLFLIPNEFNISLWVVFFSSIVFIPQLAYTIIIGSSFSDANRFILFSYLYPNLTLNVIIPGTTSVLDQPNIDYFNMTTKMPGDSFFISVAPIVSSSLIISLLFTFTFVMVKKPNLTKKSFISFYIGFLIITGISIVIFLISQYQLSQAVDYWNQQSETFKNEVMLPIFGVTKLNYVWLHGNELIASGILTFAFIGVLSTIAISHILKIKNNNTKPEKPKVTIKN